MLIENKADIVELLRTGASDLHPFFVGDTDAPYCDCALPAYLNEAADEIERLRLALREIVTDCRQIWTPEDFPALRTAESALSSPPVNRGGEDDARAD